MAHLVEERREEKATPWAALAGVTATVSVFAIAQGLSYPLFTFVMQAQGYSPTMIGLSAAMTPLGIIASAALVPVATRMFGARRLAIFCAFFAAVLLFLVGWLQNPFAWFALRFLIGVAIDPLYVLSEVWMLSLSPPARRGRVMGVYTAIVGAGFAAGPLSLTLVGTQGWPPFLVGIGAFLACGLCLLAVASRLPDMTDGHEGASIGRFARLAPTLLLAVAVTAGFEQSMLALMPVYGADGFGVEERAMAALLTVLIAGNIVLQIPLGLLAERVSPRLLMLGCTGLSLAGALALPWLFDTILIWPLAFVLGATAYGIYTTSLIELGNRFSGGALVAGNAAFALMWGVGGIVGPPASGFAMQAFGVDGLPAALAAMCLALLLYAAHRARRRGGA